MIQAKQSSKVLKNNHFSTKAFLIGCLITSQASLIPLPANATDSTTSGPGWSDRLESGCGYDRPFVKGYTNWSGWSSQTWGWASANFKKWNGYTRAYETIVYVPGPNETTRRSGARNTSTADAGSFLNKGWFDGVTLHNTSFYTFTHRKDSAEFTCPNYVGLKP